MTMKTKVVIDDLRRLIYKHVHDYEIVDIMEEYLDTIEKELDELSKKLEEGKNGNKISVERVW